VIASTKTSIQSIGKRYAFCQANAVGICLQCTGHLWMVLERQLCHVLAEQDFLPSRSLAASTLSYMRLTRVPDEKVTLTVLLNSPAYRHSWLRCECSAVVRRCVNIGWSLDATRYEQWLPDANHPLTLRQLRSNTARNNDNGTFTKLINSNRLFARKFAFTKSKHLLSRLYAYVTHRPYNITTF
jgi:hypothetical protein